MSNFSNILSSLNVYGNWELASLDPLTDEDRAELRSAKIVQGNYGLQVCLFLRGGGQSYMNLSTKNPIEVTEGDVVDLNTAEFETLTKQGSAPIHRLRVNSVQ